MNPISDFISFCEMFQDGTIEIKFFIGSPLTPMVYILQSDKIKKNTTYIAAMSGAWNGEQNLLGMNFNNAVDYDASVFFFNLLQKKELPNAVCILSTTETCKNGPFTLTPDRIRNLNFKNERSRELTASNIEQWANFKMGKTQPLYDVTILLSQEELKKNVSLIEVEVIFDSSSSKKITIGSKKNISMNLFPKSGTNVFATAENNFTPECDNSFLRLFFS